LLTYDVAGQEFLLTERLETILKLPAPIQPFGHVRLYDALRNTCHSDLEKLAHELKVEIPGCVSTIDLLRIVASHLQLLWYEQLSPGRQAPAHVVESHQDRVREWETLVTNIKEGIIMAEKAKPTATANAEAKPKAPKAAKAPAVRATYLYALIPENVEASKQKAKFDNAESHNHDAMIVRALRGHKTPQPLEAVVAKVEQMGGYATKDPLPTSVRWHLNKLEKDGIVKAIPVETKAGNAVAPASGAGQQSASA
jgi:hypothetical protein